jgi:His/Glu/Gln/Arg/opine family amino acid ABC transporter permease subunit
LKKTLFAIFILAILIGVRPVAHAQTNKPLRWGADLDGGVPYVMPDPDDPEKVIGVEADLAKALEKQLGRTIEFKQRQFDSLLSDVERGDIDIAMNGLEITPENLKKVAFSKPYYVYQLQLTVKAGESRFQTIEQARDQGLHIGTLGGTAADRLLDKLGVAKEIYDDQVGPYTDLLKNDRVQGVLLDLPIALYYASPDTRLKHSRCKQPGGYQFAGPPFADGYYGIAVNKNNPGLVEDLNRAIDQLRESGELKTIFTKWELWNTDQYRLYTSNPTFEEAREGMPFSLYFPLLLDGAQVTVLITLASMLLAVLLGLPLALFRLYGPAPLRFLSWLYVEFFRGIPVLLLLYFLYYGLAAIAPALTLGPLQAAILGFGMNYAAYEAEIYRAGISSIPVGQWEAAASLGMPKPLTFRRIILPQAIRIILPPMTNDLVALFKDTSVVAIIAVVELSKQYQILTKSGGGYVAVGLTTAALYLIMSVPLGYLSRYLEQRWGTNG